MNPQNPQNPPPQIGSAVLPPTTPDPNQGLKPGAEITFSQREIAKAIGLDPEKASEAEIFNVVQKRNEGDRLDATSLAEAEEYEKYVGHTFVNRFGASGKWKYKVEHLFPEFLTANDSEFLAKYRILKFTPGNNPGMGDDMTMSCKQFLKEFKEEA